MHVYSDLKSSILSKKYDIGTLLPPEPELEQLYGVSRTTVRKAIAMLFSDGYITVRQGYGTQVINRKYEYLLKHYSLRYTDAKDTISAISANYEEAMLLGVEPKTALMTIKRICNINETIAEVDDVKIIADKYEFEIYMKE